MVSFHDARKPKLNLDEMHEGEKTQPGVQESRMLTSVQFLILTVHIRFYAMYNWLAHTHEKHI
jgi:hypothetical protein